MVKNMPATWETQVWSLSREDPPGEGNNNPLQYSCLENPTARGAWRATVHGVAKSWTWLSDWHFHRISVHALIELTSSDLFPEHQTSPHWGSCESLRLNLFKVPQSPVSSSIPSFFIHWSQKWRTSVLSGFLLRITQYSAITRGFLFPPEPAAGSPASAADSFSFFLF